MQNAQREKKGGRKHNGVTMQTISAVGPCSGSMTPLPVHTSAKRRHDLGLAYPALAGLAFTSNAVQEVLDIELLSCALWLHSFCASIQIWSVRPLSPVVMRVYGRHRPTKHVMPWLHLHVNLSRFSRNERGQTRNYHTDPVTTT